MMPRKPGIPAYRRRTIRGRAIAVVTLRDAGTGRRTFLMELDPLYCDVICERRTQFTGKLALRIDSKGTQTKRSELLRSAASDRR